MHQYFDKDQLRQHFKIVDTVVKLRGGDPSIGLELDLMPWLRYFGNRAWRLIQETVTNDNRLYIGVIQDRLNAFDGVHPECVLDTLKMEQQLLRDKSNGEHIITGKSWGLLCICTGKL